MPTINPQRSASTSVRRDEATDPSEFRNTFWLKNITIGQVGGSKTGRAGIVDQNKLTERTQNKPTSTLAFLSPYQSLSIEDVRQATEKVVLNLKPKAIVDQNQNYCMESRNTFNKGPAQKRSESQRASQSQFNKNIKINRIRYQNKYQEPGLDRTKLNTLNKQNTKSQKE